MIGISITAIGNRFGARTAYAPVYAIGYDNIYEPIYKIVCEIEYRFRDSFGGACSEDSDFIIRFSTSQSNQDFETRYANLG